LEGLRRTGEAAISLRRADICNILRGRVPQRIDWIYGVASQRVVDGSKIGRARAATLSHHRRSEYWGHQRRLYASVSVVHGRGRGYGSVAKERWCSLSRKLRGGQADRRQSWAVRRRCSVCVVVVGGRSRGLHVQLAGALGAIGAKAPLRYMRILGLRRRRRREVLRAVRFILWHHADGWIGACANYSVARGVAGGGVGKGVAHGAGG